MQTTNAALSALEGLNIVKAKQGLANGICLYFIIGKNLSKYPLNWWLSLWHETICGLAFVLDILDNGYKILFKIPPRHIQMQIALQPRVATVLFAKLFRDCWPVAVCEKSQIILNFVIHCMLLSSH